MIYASVVTDGWLLDIVEVLKVGITPWLELGGALVSAVVERYGRKDIEGVIVPSGRRGPVRLVVVLAVVLEETEGVMVPSGSKIEGVVVVVEHGQVVTVAYSPCRHSKRCRVSVADALGCCTSSDKKKTKMAHIENKLRRSGRCKASKQWIE